MNTEETNNPKNTDETNGEATENTEAVEQTEEQTQEQSEQQSEQQPVELTAEDQIENLELQLVTAQEDVLRAKAEAQNSANRATQQIEKAHKFALDKFAGDLVPIVDNLERALESCSNSDDANVIAIQEGIALTLKSFIDTLQRYNIEQINPEGEPFDPLFHQAVAKVPNDDVEPNSVLTVHQKGYTLNQRLVRPALVVVSAAN